MIAALYYSGQKFQVSPVWAALAKLTFNAYILHMPLVYLFNWVPAFQQAAGPYELLAALPFALVLSFVASFIFYCLVESPLGRVTGQICYYVKI